LQYVVIRLLVLFSEFFNSAIVARYDYWCWKNCYGRGTQKRKGKCVRLQAVEFGKELTETSCINNRLRRIRRNLIMVTVEKK
jgi:hypothetical protein